ncbi:hypothetical protein [Tenacibaculum aquimarinum]|uniref:hypothetical protein n=1 Tax=Tenacibaculum aquimarinum TaxID=2910675 RepID=UPI001F0B547E|nr:hypothetical protein [Tenacibaculum aquimarinum]MCH3884403.1 hypothetical protein [Tenacibaculum aquimarinum]
MKKLETKIIGKGEVKGFLFTQKLISNKAYLYEVNTGYTIHYEVFKRKHKTNSKRDCFPTSKAFGLWAYTFKTWEKAVEKFNKLNIKEND